MVREVYSDRRLAKRGVSLKCHFQRCVVWASLCTPDQLVPGSTLPCRPAGALLGSGWSRQDVLGRKAPGTLTIETVRGGRLAAHRFQPVPSCERSPSPGADALLTGSSPGGRRPPARPLLPSPGAGQG